MFLYPLDGVLAFSKIFNMVLTQIRCRIQFRDQSVNHLFTLSSFHSFILAFDLLSTSSDAQ